MGAGSEESTNIVRFLKTNSGKKGQGMPVVRNPQFYFREGICWILTLNEQSEYLKARLKAKTVNDVNAMTLYPFLDSEKYLYYFLTLINSYSIFLYKRTFISGNSAFQINDARQLPIVIPSELQLKQLEELAQKAIFIQRFNEEGNSLDAIQQILDKLVKRLYNLQS